MSIDSKFRKAASACLESGAIFLDGEDFMFSIGGAASFVDELTRSLTAGEKQVWLCEYVMTWSDEQVEGICEYVQSDRVNPLKRHAWRAATKILASDEMQFHLSEEQREIDQRMSGRSVMEQFDDFFKGAA